MLQIRMEGSKRMLRKAGNTLVRRQLVFATKDWMNAFFAYKNKKQGGRIVKRVAANLMMKVQLLEILKS